MKMNRKNGISLIVLVITIIVIIILAGAVILSLSANNPISQASKATYLSDVKNFETELELYKGKQFLDNTGSYNPTLLQADNDSVTYNGVLDTSITMKNLISSLGAASKYNGQFQVIAGKLIYGGLDTNKQAWTLEAGLEVVIIGEPKITILAPSPILAERGTNIVYTVKFSSNLALTTINLASKVEILDNAGVALPVQPVISVGTVSGTATDTARQVDITITTSNLANGSYKLKIKPGVVTNSNSISNTIDTISVIGFDILDSIPPVNPTMVASPTIWTNGNVSVTISYSADSVTKEYSTNGTTWNAYTTPVVVSSNTTTIYAKGKDVATNESGVASLTVVNIDKILPTVVFETNGASNVIAASTKVTANDIGGSLINTLSYKWDTQNTVVPVSGWTAFTNASTITKAGPGTYYLWINVIDGAGNNVVTKSNAFVTISPIITFSYTGNYQMFTAPVAGNYKLEAWGSSGGNSTRYTTKYGGKGGYTSGIITLTVGQILYIYIGESGGPTASNDTITDNGGWNGGGSIAVGQNAYGAPGGGATDFRTTSGIWSNIVSLNSRILVAGGGGGANSRDGDYPSTPPAYNTGYGNGTGGDGGGLIGKDGTTGNQDSFGLSYGYGIGAGGTQTSGGICKKYMNGVLVDQTAESGSFGTGGGGGQSGGGGGWYGGGFSYNHGGAGGGSSYIGGVTAGVLQSGINSGNGKAIITFINQ